MSCCRGCRWRLLNSILVSRRKGTRNKFNFVNQLLNWVWNNMAYWFNDDIQILLIIFWSISTFTHSPPLRPQEIHLRVHPMLSLFYPCHLFSFFLSMLLFVYLDEFGLCVAFGKILPSEINEITVYLRSSIIYIARIIYTMMVK